MSKRKLGELARLGASMAAAAMWAIHTLLFRKSGLAPIESVTS